MDAAEYKQKQDETYLDNEQWRFSMNYTYG